MTHSLLTVALSLCCIVGVWPVEADRRPLSNGAASNALKPRERIVGGLPVNEVPIPYMVSIMTFGYHTCGGAIISQRTVVTAAHCLAPTTARNIKVHVGDKTREVQEGDIVAVAAIHYHEQWTRKTMDYDIGIARLETSLTFNARVQPIALVGANTVLRDGSYATVTGWGFTSVWGPGSEILRYARLPLVNQAKCKRLMGNSITERMLCAGEMIGGVDACQMDSGGPLVQNERLIGIVSWGIGCALANRPGVYTRVQLLLPWLNETLSREYKESI